MDGIRTYEELTAEEKAEAKDICASLLLRDILSGYLVFDDGKNKDDLQVRIDKAIRKADAKQTPWFAHEYIMDTCKNEILGIASADAADSIYVDNSINVIRLKGTSV